MKKKLVFLLLFLGLGLTGCLVKSLHPFYKESDIVYTDHLIGTWTDSEGNTWIFNRYEEAGSFMGKKEKRDAYRVVLVDGDSVENDSYFTVTYFRLKGHYYFDFEPLRDENLGDNFASLHFVPGHSVARVYSFGKDNILFHWYDEDWLNTLFEENRVKISHEIIEPAGYSEQSYILTASTEELQKFLIKYGPEADVISKIKPEEVNLDADPAEIHQIINQKLEELDDDMPQFTLLVNMKKQNE